MAGLKFQPVCHDHKVFLEKTSRCRSFNEAYEALEPEYTLAHEMLAARTRAGLTQEAVATRMDITKSAISRLESAGKLHPRWLRSSAMSRLSGALSRLNGFHLIASFERT